MTNEAETPRYSLRHAVEAARYYPPESHTGPDGRGGIEDLAINGVTTADGARDGLVTLSFEGYRGGEPFGYEFDLSPEAAYLFSIELLEAAGKSGLVP